MRFPPSLPFVPPIPGGHGPDVPPRAVGSGGRRLPPRLVVVLLAAWGVVLLAGPRHPAAGEVPPRAPVDPRIGEWIAQLGSDQFAQREAASHSLVEAGAKTLPSLAAAASGDDLEIASRAIEIIRGFLAAYPAADGMPAEVSNPADATSEPHVAQETSQQAERLLEALAEGETGPVAQLASTTLEFHQMGMAEAARERLESLGARFNDGFLPSGRRGLEVVIDSHWKGGVEDLRLLPRIRSLRHLGIHGIRLDPPAVAALGRMRGVETFHLYGTGISDDVVTGLAARFPNAEIDIRRGGKLGVGGQRTIGPCQITQVMAGSAADKAGIQIGDVVLSMDGEAVANFEGLTDFIGRRGPGESIEVMIERAIAGKVPERRKVTVTLDGWD
ncbi:MAG: PDZ domain-containing protein [Planctomycetota bacterium]|nr:MAG: PDZ domain-containing protein [Planctomycetota bacterium]